MKMTQAEWMACTEPEKMIRLLCGKASDRKWRLFGLACCLRLRPILFSNQSSLNDAVDQAFAMTEQFADGLIDPDAFHRTVYYKVDCRAIAQEGPRAAVHAAAKAVRLLLDWHSERSWGCDVDEVGKDVFFPEEEDHYLERNSDWAVQVSRLAVETVRCHARQDHKAVRDAERAWQADLIRDLFSNPFRRPPLQRGWLNWNDATIHRLAQRIYDERAFHLLPILADALEEAGCDNADILAHLRGTGPHARGCWAVDLLTGKE